MLILLFRTFLIYLFLMLTMRLMGKRQLGELQVSELISTLLLSEVAAIPIADPNLPIAYALIPAAFIVLLEILLPSLFFHLPKLRKLIEGTPSVLIENGEICQSELRKNRITPEEFYSILRTNGVISPSDVAYAILEASGAISIFLYAKKQPPTCEDQTPKIRPPEPGIMHILVADGRIKENTLERLKLSPDEVHRMLKKEKTRLDEVYLFTVDDLGKTELIRKSRKKGGKMP
ncbi:MAG: DUF421 domain-containing protein [Eubacteriales bacterium]